MDQQTLLTETAQPDTAASAGDTTAGATNAQTTDATKPEDAAPGAKVEGAPGDKPAQGSDAKPADGKTEDTKTPDPKDAKAETPAGAPEKYEAFTVPEGFAIDPEMLAEFSPVLKELNLPQAAAQKVIDFAPKLIEKATQQAAASFLEQTGLKGFDTWAAAVKTDKELGGDKLAENLAVAKKAMDTFGSPELRAVLSKTGLGNHPEMVRAFYRAGKQISEDGFVPGGAAGPSADARRLFNASNMNP